MKFKSIIFAAAVILNFAIADNAHAGARMHNPPPDYDVLVVCAYDGVVVIYEIVRLSGEFLGQSNPELPMGAWDLKNKLDMLQAGYPGLECRVIPL